MGSLAALERAVSELVTLLSGGVQATTRDGARASDVFVPFRNLTTMSGTTGVTVWTPQTGRRYVLRGGYVAAVVTTVLAGSDGILELIDSGTGLTVCPVGIFGATQATGTALWGTGPRVAEIDLREGVAGSVVGATLKLQQSVTVGSGVIAVSGVLWGTEVTG